MFSLLNDNYDNKDFVKKELQKERSVEEMRNLLERFNIKIPS